MLDIRSFGTFTYQICWRNSRICSWNDFKELWLVATVATCWQHPVALRSASTRFFFKSNRTKPVRPSPARHKAALWVPQLAFPSTRLVAPPSAGLLFCMEAKKRQRKRRWRFRCFHALHLPSPTLSVIGCLKKLGNSPVLQKKSDIYSRDDIPHRSLQIVPPFITGFRSICTRSLMCESDISDIYKQKISKKLWHGKWCRWAELFICLKMQDGTKQRRG